MKYIALALVTVFSLFLIGCPRNPGNGNGGGGNNEAKKLSECAVTPALSDEQKSALDTVEADWDGKHKDKDAEAYKVAKDSLKRRIDGLNATPALTDAQKTALKACAEAKQAGSSGEGTEEGDGDGDDSDDS